MKTYREALNRTISLLEEAGIDNPSYDGWALFEEATGMNRVKYLLEQKQIIADNEEQLLEQYVARRMSREPLQHILGYAYFYGRKYNVSPAVLIPRHDTEVVVETALGRLHADSRVLDMCTGSGCIGITVALECVTASVDAVDISPQALEVARRNAGDLGADVRFVHSDLFENLKKDILYDMIISNPPYIPTKVIEGLAREVKEYDPMLALDGSEDGLLFYRRIVDEARNYLKHGGEIVFEIGHDQADSVSTLLADAGYSDIYIKKDLAGLDRVAGGIWLG